MDTMRLKLKVGDHEFEAEGPPEVVQTQLATWKELVADAGRHSQQKPPDQPGRNTVVEPRTDLRLDTIMKIDGRVVSLTARGQSAEDEIMLVLLGQKILRGNDSVTGSEIISGLKQTSGRPDGRIDYRLNKMVDAGDVISFGERRGRRYRLTNQGAMKAQEIAKAVISTVT